MGTAMRLNGRMGVELQSSTAFNPMCGCTYGACCTVALFSIMCRHTRYEQPTMCGRTRGTWPIMANYFKIVTIRALYNYHDPMTLMTSLPAYNYCKILLLPNGRKREESGGGGVLQHGEWVA